mgnify:FL=1
MRVKDYILTMRIGTRIPDRDIEVRPKDGPKYRSTVKISLKNIAKGAAYINHSIFNEEVTWLDIINGRLVLYTGYESKELTRGQRLREAMLDGEKVYYEGIEYNRISGIIYRKHKTRRSVAMQAELEDKSKNSITIASPLKVKLMGEEEAHESE